MDRSPYHHGLKGKSENYQKSNSKDEGYSMATLSPTQGAVVDYVESLAAATSAHLPSLVIHGPRGVGKRTVAAEVARRLGIRFVEVNVSDAAEFVRQRLFGTEGEAVVASSIDIPHVNFRGYGRETPGLAEVVAPGELGADDEKLVFLADFERIDGSLFQRIQQLVQGRTYTDARGHRWAIGDYTWLVVGLNHTEDVACPSNVGLDHWICACFERHVSLDSPRDEIDMVTICDSILQEYGRTVEAGSCAGLLDTIEGTSDKLHSLRRWLVDAVFRSNRSEPIRKAVLERAVANDLRSMLPQLRYRGRHLSMDAFEKWAEQFGEDRGFAVHIIREIATRYYVTDREYFSALETFVERSGVPAYGRVIFAKWQGLGQSAPRVAHQLKNLAHWRVNQCEEIDFNKAASDWPDLDPRDEHNIIVVDDFVGTGGTITPLFFGEHAPVRCLLNRLPRCRIFVGVIAGFENGLREVFVSLREYGDRVTFVPSRVFDESDRCFDETSRIFPQKRRRERFKEFCKSVALAHYPRLPKTFHFGFRGTGCLVVFPDTVPNNSIPILWHNEGTWFPIFPASGLPDRDVIDKAAV